MTHGARLLSGLGLALTLAGGVFALEGCGAPADGSGGMVDDTVPVTLSTASYGTGGGEGEFVPPQGCGYTTTCCTQGGSSLAYIDWIENGTCGHDLYERGCGGQYTWNVSRGTGSVDQIAYGGDALPVLSADTGSFSYWFQMLCPPYTTMPQSCDPVKYKINQQPSGANACLGTYGDLASHYPGTTWSSTNYSSYVYSSAPANTGWVQTAKGWAWAYAVDPTGCGSKCQ